MMAASNTRKNSLSSARMTIKAILFDFMGTCLDWHTAITTALPADIDEQTRSDFALHWRQTYFDANEARRVQGLAPEDIDLTHRNTLHTLLSSPKYSHLASRFTDQIQDRLIRAWHRQPAWPDVAPALQSLKDAGYEIYVHANGTTRLQLDLCAFSGLSPHFDMLFSSQLLGAIKPDPEAWRRALASLKLAPEECVQVAAHAYDTRGAMGCGLKGVYVFRWTDDIEEDQEVVRREHDACLTGSMEGLAEVIAGLNV